MKSSFQNQYCILAHPFFRDLHDVNDEPTGERMVDEHADATYSVARWKSE